MIPGSATPFLLAKSDGDYKIERSLRFNSADSAYLNRTPSSAGNRKTWTWSGWVKRSQLTVSGEYIFTCSAAGNDYTTLHFGSSDDKLNFQGNNGSGSLQFNLQTTAVFRDPSAWYHIVLSVDSTQATDSNKVKIYVNGELQTFSTATYPPDNFAFRINTTQEHRIGSLSSQSTYLDSYLADVHFIDGQALAPTDFGKLDDNSVWQPKEFTGSYTSTNTSTTLSQTGWTVSTPTSENTIWDGNTSTQSNGHNGGTIGTVSFSPALTNVTKVEVYQQDYVHYLNGSQVTTSQSGTGWHTLYDSSSPITLSSVGNAYTNNTQTVDIMAIRINDSIVDSKTWTPPSGVGVQNTGVNSFYLKLADNSSNAALGTDSSGNSNTWTVNNISGPGGDADYASMVTQGSDGGYNAGSEAATAFDGSLTTAPNTSASNNNGNITFTPSPSISHTTSIRAYWKWGNSSATYSYNGGSNTSITASGWITLASGSGTFTSLNTYRGGDGQFFSAIEIDGTILISSTGADNDSLIDTPTNYDDGTNVGGNYATLNPLTKSSSASTLTNGNLDFDVTAGGVWSSALGTIAFTTEKIYFETTLVKVNSSTGCNAAGAVVAVRRLADQANWAISGNDNYTVRFTDNGCYKNGAATATNGVQASGGNVAAGDVIGFAIDGTNGTYGIYRNGVVQASGSIGITGYSSGDALIPFVAGFPDGGGYTYGKFSNFNFGQRPFAYTPPTGYKSLCTQNLADPTIADGSTAFDILTWTGDGSGARTVSGLNLSDAPDFVWSKTRNNGYHNNTWDSVRGYGSNATALITDYLGAANGGKLTSATASSLTFDGGVWHNENARTYVAWAWDAGSSNTSISAGGLNSSAYDQSQTWSGQVSGTVYSSTYGKTNGFSGSISNQGILPADGQTLTFTPSPSFSNAKTVKIYYYYPSSHADAWKINGTSVGNDLATTGGSLTYTFNVEGSGFTSLAWSRNLHGSEDAGVYAIEVDGKLLVDNGVTVKNVPTIATTVRANPNYGFSISKADVAASLTGGPTVAHGLNAKPDFIIGKNVDSLSIYWRVFHKDLQENHYLGLNRRDAEQNSSAVWGDNNSLDSNVFQIGAGTPASMWIPSGTNTCIFYAWSEVKGYSKFGSYTGNGSADGPFAYTGFTPKWIMFKNAGTAGDEWMIYDSKRKQFNAINNALEADTADSENASGYDIDILSNGFKVRNNNNRINYSGQKIIYAAFAERPFKSARAR